MFKSCMICGKPVPKQEPGDDTAHCEDCDAVYCDHHMQTHKQAKTGYRCKDTVDWVDNCPPITVDPNGT